MRSGFPQPSPGTYRLDHRPYSCGKASNCTHTAIALPSSSVATLGLFALPLVSNRTGLLHLAASALSAPNEAMSINTTANNTLFMFVSEYCIGILLIYCLLYFFR